MGVLGLWEILESVGHPVKVEGLEGKVLGVDANIWLYKFIRGFREKDGASNIESHKLGLFNRISKLLFYRIKPVFVFDGPAPILKRRTLERRQNTRNKTLSKVQDAAMKALANQLKSQYPDQDIDHLTIKLPELRSNNLAAAEKLGEEDFNLFYLPPEPNKKKEDSDEYESDSDDDREHAIRDSTKVDVNSRDFQSMPPEIKYEILQDIKAKRKRIRNVSLPDDAGSFSNLQLRRLKERREIQEKIEKCEQEICRNYTGELADGRSVQAFRVQSNKDLRILYCNNTYDPKALEKLKEQPCKGNNEAEIGHKPDLTKPTSIEQDSDIIYLSPEINKRKKKEDSDETESGSDDESDVIRDSPKVNANSIDFESMLSDTDCEILQDIVVRREPTGNDDKPECVGSSCNLDFREPEDRIQEKIEKCEQEICRNYTGELADGRSVQAFPAQSEEDLRILYCNITSDPKALQRLKADQHEDRIETEIDDRPDSTKPTNQARLNLPELRSNNLKEAENPFEQDSDIIYLSPEPKTRKKDLDDNQSDSDDDREQAIRNPTKVDVKCKDFQSMLPEIEHEILQDIEAKGKPTGNDDKPEPKETSSQLIPQSEHVANAQRATNRVTSKIIEDAKELLRLFGIPYIDAAGEAEAQCAKLEELNLTMGTITDDSDIWLFGAQNVFRYFFSDDKYVMQYKMPDIEYHIRMTRENLVCFAMLVGSDYTDGIMNVGPVTALEILSEFPGNGLECLTKFTDWQRAAILDKKLIGDKKRKKLLKYNIPSEFPSRAVYDGYMNPIADSTDENFTWGTPELDELREYARRNFGWDQKKTDEKLLPVMKRLNEKIQKTIDTFFFKTQANRNPEMFRSKRVNQALNKIAKRAALVTDVVNLSEDEEDS